MGRLNTDRFVRRTAQIVLLSAIGAMALILVLFDMAMVARAAMDLNPATLLHIATFLKILSFPFKETFAPFLVIFAGIAPMTLTSVCFLLDASSATTDKLNRVGHAAVASLLVSLLVGGVALVLLAVYKDPITISVGKESHPAIQGFIAALISFQASFLVQLLGLKPK